MKASVDASPRPAPRRGSAGFFLALGFSAVAVAVGLLLQRQEAAVLRAQREEARSTVAEIEQLRGENQQLREKQIAATELAALRSDHAALVRLRAELEALTAAKSVQK